MAVTLFKTVEDVREEIVTFGYLRDVFNDDNDYSFIVAIIISFYQQGFAKYYDEKVDKEYKQKMRFGDILKTKDNKYMILDINTELKKVGKYYIGGSMFVENDINIHLTIPYSICNNLSNAVSFFSKLSQLKSFAEADDYELNLCVKHDDEWIIKHFNGPLNPQYESIKIAIDEVNVGVYISFVHRYGKWFYEMDTEISYIDIETYFELRKDTANLVKLQVMLNDDDMGKFGYCHPVSVLWEKKREFGAMYANDNGFIYHYIGPKSEEDKMIAKMKKRYGERFDEIVSTVQLREEDYISSKYLAGDSKRY